jgi:hypothetical protein
MRLMIQVTANAALAVAGVVEILLRDGANPTGIAHSYFVPGAAGTTFGEQGGTWLDLGNGFLSAAANNVLNVNLSVALTGGECRVVACGTEE